MDENTLFVGLSAAWWEAFGSIIGGAGAIAAVAYAVVSTSRARRETRRADHRAQTIETRLRREQAEVEEYRELVRRAELHATFVTVSAEWDESMQGGGPKAFTWRIDNADEFDIRDVVIRVRDSLDTDEPVKAVAELKIVGHKWAENGTGPRVFRSQHNAGRPELEIEFSDIALNRWRYEPDRSLTLLNPRTFRVSG